MLVVCRNPDCRALICDDREDRHRVLEDDVDDLFFVCPECRSLARVAARMMEGDGMVPATTVAPAAAVPRR